MAKDSLTNLNKKDLKIANETLSAIMLHNTYKEAATFLGISEVALINRRKKYGLDEIVEANVQATLDKIKMSSPKAAQVLVTQLDSKYDQVKNKAANDILGYAIPKTNNQTNIQVNVNPILGGATAQDVSSYNSNTEDTQTE